MQALIGPGKTAANLSKFDSLVGDARRQKTASHAEPCIGLCEISCCFDFKLRSALEMGFLFCLIQTGEGFHNGRGVQVRPNGEPGLGCISLPLARGLKDATFILDLDDRHTKPAVRVFTLNFKLGKRQALPLEHRAGDGKFREFQRLEMSSIHFEGALNEWLSMGKRCFGEECEDFFKWRILSRRIWIFIMLRQLQSEGILNFSGK